MWVPPLTLPELSLYGTSLGVCTGNTDPGIVRLSVWRGRGRPQQRRSFPALDCWKVPSALEQSKWESGHGGPGVADVSGVTWRAFLLRPRPAQNPALLPQKTEEEGSGLATSSSPPGRSLKLRLLEGRFCSLQPELPELICAPAGAWGQVGKKRQSCQSQANSAPSWEGDWFILSVRVL